MEGVHHLPGLVHVHNSVRAGLVVTSKQPLEATQLEWHVRALLRDSVDEMLWLAHDYDELARLDVLQPSHFVQALPTFVLASTKLDHVLQVLVAQTVGLAELDTSRLRSRVETERRWRLHDLLHAARAKSLRCGCSRRGFPLTPAAESPTATYFLEVETFS